MAEDKALAKLGTLQQGWEMYLENVPTALIIDRLGLNEEQFLKFVRVRARELVERDGAMEKAVLIHKQNQFLEVAVSETKKPEPNLEMLKFGLEVLKEQRQTILQGPVRAFGLASGDAEYDTEKVAEALKKRRLKGKIVEAVDGEEGSAD
jgi:hypothetical protein